MGGLALLARFFGWAVGNIPSKEHVSGENWKRQRKSNEPWECRFSRDSPKSPIVLPIGACVCRGYSNPSSFHTSFLCLCLLSLPPSGQFLHNPCFLFTLSHLLNNIYYYLELNHNNYAAKQDSQNNKLGLICVIINGVSKFLNYRR